MSAHRQDLDSKQRQRETHWIPARKSRNEEQCPNAAHNQGVEQKWGPYLSGNTWEYFSHDQSRSRAYRGGEEGLGGLCDGLRARALKCADPIRTPLQTDQLRGQPRRGR